jgi:hypothetical protein
MRIPVIDRADGPPDDEPGEEIEDRGQIQLATLGDCELRRVADPALIRGLSREFPVSRFAATGWSDCSWYARPHGPRLQPFFCITSRPAVSFDSERLAMN